MKARCASCRRLVLSLSASAFAQTPRPAAGAAAAAARADATSPTSPGARIVTGQAPVVGGNAAGARERALDDAIKQAVNQAIAGLRRRRRRAPRRPRRLKAIEAKARSFVPRYRDAGGGRGERRVHDPARGRGRRDRAAPPDRTGDVAGDAAAGDAGARRARPGCWSPRPTRARPAPRSSAGLVTALSSAGVRARAGDPGETSAGAAAQAAARASLEQAALVTAEVVPEGLVRGTGRVAVSCRANVRLVAAPAGSTIAERAATARVFVEADKAADGRGAVPRRSWAPSWRAGWRARCRRRPAPARRAICAP